MRYLRGRFGILGLLGAMIAVAAVAAEPVPGQPPQAGKAPAQFTPLVPLPAPKIIGSAEAYPGAGYRVQNIIDGKEATEYSSNGKGTETYIDFDFGRPTRIAAYRHVDRADAATVGAVALLFSDAADFARPIAKVPVAHANVRAGKTFAALPDAVTARYVRWKVAKLGPQNYGTVGGAEIGFFASDTAHPVPVNDSVVTTGYSAVVRQEGKLLRSLRITVRHPYAESTDATLRLSGLEPRPLRLAPGEQFVEVTVPAMEKATTFRAALDVGGREVAGEEMVLKPVRPWVMYFLPHSHVDIGYTNVQTEIEKLQWKYLDEAMAIARKTADYPPEARFKWNSEVLWAVDSYLKRATPEKREEFIGAVKAGQVHLDALYGNELTGLCRPEELFRLLDCARRLSKQCGVTIDAAMISDVPGWTWGIVPALAQNGVKYFSMGTNHVHRIGYTLEQWGDKPFYWVSPSGQEKVLCWAAGKGYSWFHPGLLDRISKVKPESFFRYLEQLEAAGYPYDMVQLRYSIGGDNGPPDPDLPEFVKKWNARYVWPKLAIATTRELFQEFERRYGERIPQARGDFTPYWEDGAGSSARETAAARNAAERLVQTEALFAMLDPRGYPAEDFYQAWRNVLLYNEHTWGAHSSITQPESDFTKAQWKIKGAFAWDASAQCRKLFAAVLGGHGSPAGPAGSAAALEVFNTASWPRSDAVFLPAAMRVAGGVVKDAQGRVVPSQRLSGGDMVFLAADVPPMGAKRYSFHPGEPAAGGSAAADGLTLRNGRVGLTIDEKTGAIAGLTAEGIPGDLVRRDAGLGLNEYLYVAGRDPKSPQRSGKPKIAVEHRGPLVASLVIESEAPGCRMLTRVLRVVEGQQWVDVIDVPDRQQVRTPEGVHFGFALNVPGGAMRMDIPWAVIQPEKDQLPGACKNYFSVGRWVDVSNADYGVTVAVPDTPLVEVGGITTDVQSPFDPKAWISKIGPSQTFFSYAMNNYWETNYKADQPGPTTFRYALRPHGRFDPVAAARFGIERSQPLMVVPVDPKSPPVRSLLRVEPESVMVTSLKPSEDKKALMVRLFNASTQPAKARVIWSEPAPKRIAISSPKEEEGPAVTGAIEMPPSGILTLRAALSD